MDHQIVVKGRHDLPRSGSFVCSCGTKRNGISRRWANELARKHRSQAKETKKAA